MKKSETIDELKIQIQELSELFENETWWDSANAKFQKRTLKALLVLLKFCLKGNQK
jgi:hypothetical protein